LSFSFHSDYFRPAIGTNLEKTDFPLYSILPKKTFSLSLQSLRGGGNTKFKISELQRQLAPLGLCIKDVKGDGNCLYRAVSDQVDGHENNFQIYKCLAIKFISQNREIFQTFLPSGIKIDEYILDITPDGSWGGYFEILALCSILSAKFFLYMLNKPPLTINLEELNQRESKLIHLAYLEEEHYASVRMLGDINNDIPQRIQLNLCSVEHQDSLSKNLQVCSNNPLSNPSNHHLSPLTKKGLPDKRFKSNRLSEEKMSIKPHNHNQPPVITKVNNNTKQSSLPIDWVSIQSPVVSEPTKMDKKLLSHPRDWDLEFDCSVYNNPLKKCPASFEKLSSIMSEKIPINIPKPETPSCDDLLIQISSFETKIHTLESQLKNLSSEKQETQKEISQDLTTIHSALSSLEENSKYLLSLIEASNANHLIPSTSNTSCASQESFSCSKKLELLEAKLKNELESISDKVAALNNDQTQIVSEINRINTDQCVNFRNLVSDEFTTLKQDLSLLRDQSILTSRLNSDEIVSLRGTLTDVSNTLSINHLSDLTGQVLLISNNFDLLKNDIRSELTVFSEHINNVANEVNSLREKILSSCNLNPQLYQNLEQQIVSVQQENLILKDQLVLQKDEFEKFSHLVLAEFDCLKESQRLNKSNLDNAEELNNFSFIKTLQTEIELQKKYFDQQLEVLKISFQNQISNIDQNNECMSELHSLKEQINILLNENNALNERLRATEILLEENLNALDNKSIQPQTHQIKNSHPQSYTTLTRDSSNFSNLQTTGQETQCLNRMLELPNDCLSNSPAFVPQNFQNVMEEEKPIKSPISGNLPYPGFGRAFDNAKMNPELSFAPNPGKKPKTVTIPWKGRIMTPTYQQLRECEGNLDLLENLVGSREAIHAERNFKLRFVWKGNILLPSPKELLMARGDLNTLSKLCLNKSSLASSKQYFRNPCSPRLPRENSYKEF